MLDRDNGRDDREGFVHYEPGDAPPWAAHYPCGVRVWRCRQSGNWVGVREANTALRRSTVTLQTTSLGELKNWLRTLDGAPSRRGFNGMRAMQAQLGCEECGQLGATVAIRIQDGNASAWLCEDCAPGWFR